MNKQKYHIVSPLIVANNILTLSFNEKIPITPMKLQKLLYFLYREYLKETKFSLFSERFEAWKYGPVLNSVYYAFIKYKDKPIKKYYIDNKKRLVKVNESSNIDFKICLLKVWDTYKHYNGISLAIMSCKEGTAWRYAFENGKIFLDDSHIMKL